MALFAPHGLGGEVGPGWVLQRVSIAAGTITVTLRGPSEGVTARVVLHHPDRAPDGSDATRSFGVVTEGPPASAAARAALVEALRRNDDGTFWDARGLVATLPNLMDERHHERPLPEAVPRVVRDSPIRSVAFALLALGAIGVALLWGRRAGDGRR
jgi:hypothetical protein